MLARSKIRWGIFVFLCIVGAAKLAWEVHKARTESAYESCSCVLKRISGAMATWALENKKRGDDIPAWRDLVGPQGYIRDMPVCPEGGIYTLGKVTEWPRCSHGGRGHSLEELNPANPVAEDTETSTNRAAGLSK